MPIKFRCQHCKQLLGIAHSKAGSLVDCPTCGRTLRVPNLDGSVDPPPALGMNLADDGLRRALDELGQIGRDAAPAENLKSVSNAAYEGGGENPPVPKTPQTVVKHLRQSAEESESVPPSDGEREIKQRPVKPHPSWTDGVAQRVLAEKPAHGSEELGNDPQRPLDLSAQPLPPSNADGEPRAGIVSGPLPAAKSVAIALEPLPSQVAVDPPAPRGAGVGLVPVTSTPGQSHADVLAGLADAGAKEKAKAGSPRESKPKLSVERKSFALATAIRIGTACFLIGLAVGVGVSPWLASRKSPPEAKVPAENTVAVERNESASGISGVLSYRNLQGQLQPDAGARVLLVPVTHPVGEKLSSLGFRPADDEAEQATAKQAFAELGGTIATADEQGHFHIDVTGKGEFRLILLSRFQSRAADLAWPKLATTVLYELFDQPEKLVGKSAFHVETIQYTGSGPFLWHHVSEHE